MILAPPSAPRERVGQRLFLMGGVHARFRDEMFKHLWEAAEACGVDPVGMVAQAGIETGWGHFSGKVRPEFHNTCGLKIHTSQQALFPGITDDDNPLAHAMFASWRVGATAHAQHLCAYAGKMVDGLIVDPRFGLVGGPKVTQWRDLGGRWAPNPSYGMDIERTMDSLRQGA